ncbi:MAG: hypothetical protein U1E14_19165 [Geminicoccaceae bacterium]
MPYRRMAQLSASLAKIDRLFVLHLLSHRDFTADELVRVTKRTRREVEAALEELVEVGIVHQGEWRGHRFYNLASPLVGELLATLLPDRAIKGRQRHHLRLVHATAEPVTALVRDAQAFTVPTRRPAALRAVSSAP